MSVSASNILTLCGIGIKYKKWSNISNVNDKHFCRLQKKSPSISFHTAAYIFLWTF